MNKYIQRIHGVVPNTSKIIDIPVNGSNLIITGINGSGKTSFLEEVYRKVELLIVQKKQADLESIKLSYEQTKKHWEEKTTRGTSQYSQFKQATERYKKEIEDIENGLNLDIPDNITFSSSIDDKVAVVRLFEASRIAKISHANSAHGLDSDQEVNKSKNNNENFGNNLEQHLVNLITRKSLALSEDVNTDLANNISDWFEQFALHLKDLMEDNSTELEFNSNTLKFTIHQKDKPSYTFQTLSSGYMSIFDIYADLLMRTEYFNVTPSELTGVVFIDEIDAHLHVSLQRRILPFFNNSFPKIQFIVTTHSPFVLMSVNDTVIFDIGQNSIIDEDLSLYSYSAVMEGLLGTKSTSVLLDKIILDIAVNAQAEEVNYPYLRELIEKIEPIEEKLDIRSKAFYMIGVNELLNDQDK